MATVNFSPRPEVTPTIYAYELIGVESHKGYLKIGYTDRTAEERVAEQLHTSAVPYRIVLEASAMRTDGTSFNDHDIHRYMRRRGFRQLNAGEDKNEWYKCNINDVKAAIVAVRNRIENDENRTLNFPMRPEQAYAVKNTIEYFRKAEKAEPNRAPKFLWNCKMRFGKTFATYQLAKRMGLKRVLVLTFKPAVESAWADDLMSHIDFEGWQFISNKDAHNRSVNINDAFEAADKSKPIVVFGSFQDLLGTNSSGGIKVKNEFIHANNWDLIAFDEYHFGAWRENAKKLFDNPDEEAEADFDQEKYKRDEADNAINETFLPITTSYYLYLSGTPFRAINSGEFIEDQIYNWTYSDEQRAKENWKGSGNPYISLPKMVMMTYRIPDSIRQIAMEGEFNEFSLNLFFKAKYKKGDVPENSRFIFESEVKKWVQLIRGSYLPSNVDEMKVGQRPPMPYSDARLLAVLNHTLWYLPNVASCYAMFNVLREDNYFSDYKIIVAAGTKAGIGLDALAPVQNAMGNPLETKTITLSCGKLTTGVTIKPWTGVFMLRDMSSPESYFQTAFRVQSPWTIRDDNGNQTIICNDCGHTWQTQDVPKKRKTWLWVLGWIFIFPLPLTIILIRKKDMNNILKCVLIALAWIVYLAISISAGINNSDRDTNTQAEANPSTTIASSSETESNKSSNTIASEKETKEITSEIGSETETKETTSKIGSETESFVNAFNNKSTVKLSLKESFDPQDKTSGHYRTEFRLTAYRDAIGNSYDYNGKTVDLIERQGVFDEKPVIRLYADDISIDECCDIIESSVTFFDPELSQEDISEITTHIKEEKAVNGYYKGNVSILYLGDLMIKYAND